jgi:hypothetical protein
MSVIIFMNLYNFIIQLQPKISILLYSDFCLDTYFHDNFGFLF